MGDQPAEKRYTTVQVDVETRDLLNELADMEQRSMGAQVRAMVVRELALRKQAVRFDLPAEVQQEGFKLPAEGEPK